MVRPERQAVAEKDPLQRHEARRHQARRQDGRDSFVAGQTSVKERQGGDQEEDQRGTRQHPGGVAGIDLGKHGPFIS
jgi:hypothetical protein